VVKVLKPGTYKLATRMTKNSPMLGTSNSYIAFTLRKDFQVLFCYLHTQHPNWLYKCKSHRNK
jgi:hypothetical protein